jgi:pyruvate/2-oxoglutarate dehydrogenase complex dihydrolipoamide acyltransferase (E2) component
MSEGTITQWLVVEGEMVEAGQAIYMLETDKAEVAVESPCAGAIHILVPVDSEHEVGVEVARIEHD